MDVDLIYSSLQHLTINMSSAHLVALKVTMNGELKRASLTSYPPSFAELQNQVSCCPLETPQFLRFVVGLLDV